MKQMSANGDGAVLVTGGSGFIGLALCEALLSRGDTVVGFDMAPPLPAAADLFGRLPGTFVHVSGDVRDRAAQEAATSGNGVGRVVALAAITADIERERRAAASVIDVNVLGAITTFEAARAAGVGRVVYISSGSAYGAAGYQPDPLVEDVTPTQPESLYGISKLAAEQSALRLGPVFGLDVVAGRLGTCCGPWEYATGARDTPSAVLQIVNRFKAGEEVVLSRPHPRDWLYSRDAAGAIMTLLDASSLEHRIYNLAAGFKWSLVDLCARLADMDRTFRWRLADAGSANIDLYGDRDRAVMANGRIRSAGFAPRYDLDRALPDYLAWWDRALTADPV